MSNDDLDQLVTKARKRNAEAGVTGILLHRDRCFMQYIEGPKKELDRIYRIIKNDPLHSGIVEIMDEPVAARVFPEWILAFNTKNLKVRPQPERHANPNLLHPRLKDLDPNALSVHIVLNRFWNS